MIALRNRIGRNAACALLAGSVAFIASASVAAPATVAPRYDGVWSVLIVTEKGDCDRGYRYPIRIANGVLANAGDTGFTITGKVAPTGAINVTVSHGNTSANGSGLLAGDTGEGLWSGGACSGKWSAERRDS